MISSHGRRSESDDAAYEAHSIAVRASGLTISIPTDRGPVVPVDNLTLEVRRGETLGIVGETGSGKTVTCRALLGLLPTSAASHEGEVVYPGISDADLLGLRRQQLRRLWGSHVAMIPQNPMTSLSPVHRIGFQIAEAVTAHNKVGRRETRRRVIELMTMVGIPAPERRVRDYPHQFSGGMLQRTLIAIALAGNPSVLVADEPTTALDVIIQDQILALLSELKRSLNMTLIFVSHDLSVVASICDRIAVMYAGQVVELADARKILEHPRHPYTAALISSLPGAVPKEVALATIAGSPPALIGLGGTCRFYPRCSMATSACAAWSTELLRVGDQRTVRCCHHESVSLDTSAYVHGAGAGPLLMVEPVTREGTTGRSDPLKGAS